MKVYPVNAVEASKMESEQREPYSDLAGLHNRIIGYQADFNSQDVEITGSWNGNVDIDTVILGNTNAAGGSVELYDGEELLFTGNFDAGGFIRIIPFNKTNINNFKLELHGAENIRLGYLYMGEAWELPRFAVQPRNALQLRNGSDRTFYGNVTGIPVETIRSFGCDFARVANNDKKKFDDYINGVQKVIPHVVDFYPEAHEEFEPMFMTVNEYGEATKCEESGFYWNFSCSWQEAR
jgi:hypothetical protein